MCVPFCTYLFNVWWCACRNVRIQAHHFGLKMMCKLIETKHHHHSSLQVVLFFGAQIKLFQFSRIFFIWFRCRLFWLSVSFNFQFAGNFFFLSTPFLCVFAPVSHSLFFLSFYSFFGIQRLLLSQPKFSFSLNDPPFIPMRCCGTVKNKTKSRDWNWIFVDNSSLVNNGQQKWMACTQCKSDK